MQLEPPLPSTNLCKKFNAITLAATQPLYPTPQTLSSMTWYKIRDHSGGAAQPLRSGFMAAPKSLGPG